MLNFAQIPMIDPADLMEPHAVRMVSYTKPCADDLETPLQLIAYCARVSNPANQGNHETADRLIKYLIRNAHWSPLEMVDITLEIEIPRDIGRQILRHKSFFFQEFSQRYAEALGFSKPSEARLQDEKNRQNSLPCLDAELTQWWHDIQMFHIEQADKDYRAAIKRGLAKEVARKILPEGLTMSRMYMKGSIRSWIHYLAVRQDPTTQKEHRALAMAIAEAVKTIWSTP